MLVKMNRFLRHSAFSEDVSLQADCPKTARGWFIFSETTIQQIFICVLVACCFTGHVFAQDDVHLTDKELARESVLPVIENPQSVRDRNVSKTGSLSLYPLLGAIVNNPFFFNLAFGGTIGYHFNEFHSINLFGAYMHSSSTKYVDDIVRDPDLTMDLPNITRSHLKEFKNFPKVNLLALLVYEFSPLYGKMSFSKNMVLNTDLLISAGAGTIIFGGGSYLPAFTLGIGQRFYFGKNWGIRFDLIGLMYPGPNYTSLKGPAISEGSSETYTLNHFNRQFSFHFLCSVGLIVLL